MHRPHCSWTGVALIGLGVWCWLGGGCSDSDDGSPPQPSSAGAGEGGIGPAAGANAGSSGRAGTSAANAGRAGAATAGRAGAGQGGAGRGGEAGRGNAGAAGVAGSAGTAGAAGSAGAAGTTAVDPDGCNMAFAAANKCNPQVTFANDEADGDGAMFDQVIDDPIATLKSVACQVCTILYRDPSEVTRQPSSIRLHIHDFDGVANAGGGTINFSSRHIANYDDPEDARFEFLGVLIHETTHMYQFDDGGGGLVEGMADFVRIRAGHHRLNRRNPGGAWTDAYTTSGFFFSWLAGPGGLQPDGRQPADPDIGWAINQQMNGNWSEAVFMERLDADVDTLWNEYQDAIR